MPARTSRANGRKSRVRSKVEHAFAHQKARMGLTIRTPIESPRNSLPLQKTKGAD